VKRKISKRKFEPRLIRADVKRKSGRKR